MAALHRVPGVTYGALVPNVRGAELAAAAGVDGLSLTVSASEGYSQRNVRMSVEESLAQVAAVRAAVGDDLAIDTVVSCAFGSPYEGDIAPAEVAALGARAVEGGSTSVTYADTTGMASPRRVDELVALDRHRRRPPPPRHPRHRARQRLRRPPARGGPVRHRGGRPGRLAVRVSGAGANLATEDLVHLCDDLGVETGIDLAKLLGASARVARLVGRAVPSRVAAAGPRSRLHRG